MYPANAFRAELRERGFQFLAAEVEGIMDTMQKDWFHKPCDRKTLKKICPDFTEAHMRFGDIKVPHADVQHIFFGFEGYVHQNLYGWKRAAGRARDLLGAHKSGMIPPPDMQGHGDHGGSGGLSHTTSAPVTLPQTTSTTANSANHADEMVPDLWVGDIPQYQANEPCLRDIFEKFGGVSLIYFRSKPNTAAANEPRSWAYITFAGEKPARAKCVNAAKILPIVVKNEQDEDVTLKVEVAERDKAVSVNALAICCNANATRALALRSTNATDLCCARIPCARIPCSVCSPAARLPGTKTLKLTDCLPFACTGQPHDEYLGPDGQGERQSRDEDERLSDLGDQCRGGEDAAL
jgi:hypothetical protein